jgi:hypothetical protein
MVEPYYNASTHGLGLEGFFNYANVLVNGWLVNLFLLFVFGASIYVMGKGEWKPYNVFTYACLVTFLAAMIFRLFTVVQEQIIFVAGVGIAVGIFWGILMKLSG